MQRVAILTLVAVGAFALFGGAATSRATGDETCATSGPLVCVSISGTPETVPPSEPGSPRYVSYAIVATNGASSTVTHAAATVTLSGGPTVVSTTPSRGSCSTTVSAVSCTIGNLASGASVSIAVVAQSPETAGAASADLVVSFDESFNDNPAPDPKQDTVSATSDTTVGGVAGSASSFVPEGASVDISTDPSDTGIATSSDPLIGDAEVTTSPTSLVASIDEVSAALTCPKKVVCRGGDWFHASIPGTFDPALAFPLRWDKTLIPSSLNAKKFALIYTECLDGCPLQVITARCSSPTPAASELPCLSGVAKLADGDFVATLNNDHNGFMH